MSKHTYVATVLTVALIAFAPCVPFQAHAQGGEAGVLERLDPDMDSTEAFAQSDRQGDIKQALKLSVEQEKLWGPVEEVLTNLWEQQRARRSALTAGEPTDQIEHLRRRAELATQRADALKKLADAVQPLWATLSDEQKRELTRSFAMVAPSRNGQRQQSYRHDDDYRHHRGAWRYDGQDRGDQDDGEWRRNRDRMMSRRSGDEVDERDDMRRDRFDRYSRRQSQDDYRPRARGFDRDQRDFERRSDRDYCRCYRYD
jgi:zinc resistance-associated protein